MRRCCRPPGPVPHAHKVLGAVVLVHTAYRLATGIATPNLAPWMAVHVLLAVSSLEFQVPRRAIAHVMDRLYRAQVVVFTIRSVLVIAAVLAVPDTRAQLRWRFLAVACSHLAADLCLRRLAGAGRPGGVRREMGPGDGQSRPGGRVLDYGRLFFSLAQLNATSQLIWVPNTDYVLIGAFMTVVVVQVTAFLQTLRKKGLLSPSLWKVVYGLMLMAVAVQMVRCTTPSELAHISAVSIVFAALRIGLGVNKYALMLLVYTWGELIRIGVGGGGGSPAS